MSAVSSQPTSLSMDPYHDEKHDSAPGHRPPPDCDCEAHSSRHRCPNSRLRRLLLPATLALLAASALLLVACLSDFGSIAGRGLVKRATDSTGGAFTQNKLYLVVIFVGLLVVLILGVMLSAWCCRGVFENPCCCPCYLCACCGGLACLECIGCGLCAEGVDQM